MTPNINNGMTPALSICIPTYNRADTVHRLVCSVLKSPCQDLEVLVLDNCSTDRTAERLSAIKDRRLVLKSNDKNRGALFNILHCVSYASGEFAILLLDKDWMDFALVERFRNFLHRELPACGYCEYSSSFEQEAEILDAGEPSLVRVGYLGHHPTGYFFHMPRLRALDIARRFGDYNLVGHFPFEFVQAEMCLRGRAAIYHLPIVSPEDPRSAAITKSFGTDAGKEAAFFSPKGRLVMSVNFSRHIESLPISARTKRQLVLQRFVSGFLSATLGYRAILRNEQICSHYHIAARHVSIAELMCIGVTFYRSFLRAYPERHAARELGISRWGIGLALLSRAMRSIWHNSVWSTLRRR